MKTVTFQNLGENDMLKTNHFTTGTVPRTINLYFGERQSVTYDRFTTLSNKLRRPRTQTLDFLLNYYDSRQEDMKLMRML